MTRIERPPTLDDIADLVADFSGTSRARITAHAQLERDLGITGDDGIELLEVVSRRFGTDFNRPDHGSRYLFGSEGFNPLQSIVRRLLGRATDEVIPITVGDLHLAVLRGRWEDPPWPAT